MARKLPWAGDPGPSPKRARTDGSSLTRTETTPARDRGRPQMRQAKIEMSPSTPRKRRTGSRSPSTSPVRGPPKVEPIMEGYDEDDIWMMVEDEFQSLAQTFTAHLHRAEYKRLVKKARDAPRKDLSDPSSPMSKETKRKLQRTALDMKQQAALGRVGARPEDDDVDAEGQEVDNPWSGTALAGLVASGSQEKHSLKGLEKMPSSTRAAQGFSKAETATRPRQMNAIDLLTRPPDKRESIQASRRREANQESTLGDNSTDRATRTTSRKVTEDEDHTHTQSRHTPNPALARIAQSSVPSFREKIVPKQHAAPRDPSRRSSLSKRKKVKEESKEDRLAEVPMFLI